MQLMDTIRFVILSSVASSENNLLDVQVEELEVNE